ncbi:hypothetical protein HZB06_01590 [Candidatus Wolfebacteria bacterium]|nr:hypothetical protein [Candidatus Wolfebacteria bacterium]
MKLTKIISWSMTLGFFGLLLASAVSAQTVTTIPPVGPTTVGGIVNLIQYLVRWVYIIFFVIAVMFLIFAAFTYLTAAGDPTKVSSAKDKLIYAVVAMIVAFLAVGFELIVRNFLISPTA